MNRIINGVKGIINNVILNVNKFIDKIGKINFILLVFIIIVIVIVGLYTTLAADTSDNYSLLAKSYKFIIGEDNDTKVTITGDSSKYMDITLKNDDSIDIKYALYYTTTNSDIDIGYTKDTKAPTSGTIKANSEIVITLLVINNSVSNEDIMLGIDYGTVNGGEINSSGTRIDKRLMFLNEVDVGSYVNYVGNGGTIGNISVNCNSSGTSSLEMTDEIEAANACKGENAREDLDSSSDTYGYCYDSNYKYNTTGWRIAYISNNKAMIVSAGSPECNERVSSEDNLKYIEIANSKALKYCNMDYVDGDCSCVDSDDDGFCDIASIDAWAINDNDFYSMTKHISGYGKRLVIGSSSLGDVGSELGSTLDCYKQSEYSECGYGNDLIDNGGYYWFAAMYGPNSTDGVYWDSFSHSVNNNSGMVAYGLRPIISLSSSVYVVGGSGTVDVPYEIKN